MKDDHTLTALANSARLHGVRRIGIRGEDIADMADEIVKLRQVNTAMRRRVGNLRSAVRGLNKAYEHARIELRNKNLKKRVIKLEDAAESLREGIVEGLGPMKEVQA